MQLSPDLRVSAGGSMTICIAFSITLVCFTSSANACHPVIVPMLSRSCSASSPAAADAEPSPPGPLRARALKAIPGGPSIQTVVQTQELCIPDIAACFCQCVLSKWRTSAFGLHRSALLHGKATARLRGTRQARGCCFTHRELTWQCSKAAGRAARRRRRRRRAQLQRERLAQVCAERARRRRRALVGRVAATRAAWPPRSWPGAPPPAWPAAPAQRAQLRRQGC